MKTEAYKLRAFEDYLVFIGENPPGGIGILIKKLKNVEHWMDSKLIKRKLVRKLTDILLKSGFKIKKKLHI